MRDRFLVTTIVAMAMITVAPACSPTVKVEAPQKPITINLNIKLDAEVRLKLEEKAKDDIQENSEIF